MARRQDSDSDAGDHPKWFTWSRACGTRTPCLIRSLGHQDNHLCGVGPFKPHCQLSIDGEPSTRVFDAFAGDVPENRSSSS